MNIEVQQAIYNALTGNATLSGMITGVFDRVPQPTDAGSDADFPYITIGGDAVQPWDTDSSFGVDSRVTIHVWSRQRGRKETKEILDRVCAILHYQELIVPAGGFVFCLLEYTETFRDPDGLTNHGISRFRMIIDDL